MTTMKEATAEFLSHKRVAVTGTAVRLPRA